MSATQPAIAQAVKDGSTEVQDAKIKFRNAKLAQYKFTGNWFLFWLLCVFGITVPFAMLYLVNRTVRLDVEVNEPTSENSIITSAILAAGHKPEDSIGTSIVMDTAAKEMGPEFAWLRTWKEKALADVHKRQEDFEKNLPASLRKARTSPQDRDNSH